MFWGRYDDLVVQVYRPDDTLRYELRQRNYLNPVNLISNIRDNRTREEAREDQERARKMNVPRRPTVSSVYTKGLTKGKLGWAGFWRDDNAFMTVPGIIGQGQLLKPTPTGIDPRRSAYLAVGEDWGEALELSARNTALGKEIARVPARYSLSERQFFGDTIAYTSTFYDLPDSLVYEAGHYLGRDLYCRHVLSRPVFPDHKMVLSLIYHVA